MKLRGHRRGSLVAVLLAGLSIGTARADVIFVTNFGSGTIGEYTTTGVAVNTALVSGLSGPQGIAVAGSDLFVANANTGTIGEYTTAGASVNPALISGAGAARQAYRPRRRQQRARPCQQGRSGGVSTILWDP